MCAYIAWYYSKLYSVFFLNKLIIIFVSNCIELEVPLKVLSNSNRNARVMEFENLPRLKNLTESKWLFTIATLLVPHFFYASKSVSCQTLNEQVFENFQPLSQQTHKQRGKKSQALEARIVPDFELAPITRTTNSFEY